MTHLHVRAIDHAYLENVRGIAEDDHGNHLRPFDATGDGEPLRCCLRYARPGEQITLISYAPFAQPSVWREIGPVYIHADRCEGYSLSDQLPGELSSGPCLLRTYQPDGTMNYASNTIVADNADLSPIVERLLTEADVETVHVRTLRPQCFLYSVTAAR